MNHSRTQLIKWLSPTKLGVISIYLGIIGFILSILFYFFPYIPTNDVDLPILPGNSGWLLLGDYDDKLQKYIRGPFFNVVDSKYSEKSAFPRKGEIIKITTERNLIIADYKSAGTEKIFQPPWQENYLEDDDYTGIKIQPGSRVEVRDVGMAHFPKMPYVVWARIGYIPDI